MKIKAALYQSLRHQPLRRQLLHRTNDIRAARQFSSRSLFSEVEMRSVGLVLSDIFALSSSWWLARSLNQFYSPIPEQMIWWTWLGLPSLFWLLITVTVGLFAYFGLYRQTHRTKNYATAGQLVSQVYLCFLVLSYFYDPHVDLPRSLFFTAWFSSVVFVVFARIITNVSLYHYEHKRKKTSVFVVADASRLRALSQLLKKRSLCEVVGVAIAATANSEATFNHIVQANPHEVFAESIPDVELSSSLFWRLRSVGIPMRLLPSSRDMIYRRGIPEVFSSLPTLKVEPSFLPGWDYRIKRTLDLFVSSIGLVACFPLFVGIAVVIKVTSPGPVFFRQERVGLHGKVFQVWKFRTMVANASSLQQQLEAKNKSTVLFKVRNDPRIISVGHFLRKTSLDELPQLFNVLLGEMSLVGPRPLPLRDTAKFKPWHHIRHQVLPGITGLWQISGRSNIEDFDDAARLDLHYIDNWSIALDLEILLETIKIVCLGKGAY